MRFAMSLDPRRGNQLRPELELILWCARTNPDEAAVARIRALLDAGLNWPDVLAIALQHHVVSFLYESLTLAAAARVPAFWLDSMRQHARKASGLALLLLSDLLRIHESFSDEQFPLIPYKGPVLSWLAYRSLTARMFIDLDFVTKQDKISRATALLEAAGFSPKIGLQEDLVGRSGQAPGQYPFFREATRTQVELHTEQTLRYFPVPLDLDKMSRRFITVEISGRKMRTFSVEDTLVMLCVHGAKHFWDRLAWIVDLAELIKSQPVDWVASMQIATDMKTTRVYLLGLYLAHELLEVALPQPVLERAQQDSNVCWLADKVRAQFEGHADASPGVIPLTMSPTERDRQTIRLPRALAPLYVLVRPLRLLREHGLGLRQRCKRKGPPVEYTVDRAEHSKQDGS
jgi:hypothetical protein